MKYNIFLGIAILVLALAAVKGVHSHSIEPTRVEADSVKSEIRLIINNKIVALLSDKGIVVKGSVAYTGTLRDAPEAEPINE